MISTIGVVTSGGDSPGMNAAARAVVRTAISEGVRIFGVYGGYTGLLDGDIKELSTRSVSDLIQRGGTFLGTGRSKRFHTEEGRKEAMEKLKEHGIEGLVVIGGDGSLTGAAHLSRHGMPIVGLPATIENDVWGTDYTIGADTAANTVLEAINKLRDTASAHRRIILIEVMGKKSGWLAMMAGVAGGAEYVLVPEVKYDLDEICTEIMDRLCRRDGQVHRRDDEDRYARIRLGLHPARRRADGRGSYEGVASRRTRGSRADVGRKRHRLRLRHGQGREHQSA